MTNIDKEYQSFFCQFLNVKLKSEDNIQTLSKKSARNLPCDDLLNLDRI